ncbi:MAG TPA: hypothetical protein VKZ51_10270 [Cyclobacteriaceae bacterium]|nr:hypothetical protein [Cyclobacteriaceae bacterium]
MSLQIEVRQPGQVTLHLADVFTAEKPSQIRPGVLTRKRFQLKVLLAKNEMANPGIAKAIAKQYRLTGE